MSAAALCFETVLARVFALTQWHHLSFMVVSIALLGFAAGGVLVSLAGVGPEVEARAVRLAPSLFGVSGLLAIGVHELLPMDFFRLPIEPVHWLYLTVSYATTAVPFFFAGIVIAAGFVAG